MNTTALERVLRRAAREYEAKANFNPNQPRLPRGNPRGGEWTRVGAPKGDAAKEVTEAAQFLAPEEREGLDVSLRAQSRAVQQFIARNKVAITRTLGALQMVGGAGEMVGGAGGLIGGAATSELGFGIPVAAVSAWMVTHGYDDFATGWRSLTTGDPQETDLHRALRRVVGSDNEAIAIEILLAGGVGAGATRLSGAGLREAARRGLARRALENFAQEPLNVRSGSVRIWDEVNIQARGEAWEVFDAARTGVERTPRQFRVFDQFDRISGVAVSNKTLDLAQPGYSLADRNAVYNTMAGYVDRIAGFQEGRVEFYRILRSEIREQRLHVLFPAGEVLPGQALQIAAAERYAAHRGVILQVEYAR